GLAAALGPAWAAGASPVAALRALADRRRAEQRRRAREAAARLGVRLLLPLATCLLPAFVLLGLVPVVLSLLDGLLGG
ncbi:type II secretion system F family protein, partial [Cellulomonas endophytica]|uniref:type II secretion system F family protein n=1 Tax=Cellulomonas endophytica TaxID=2494735 RepID=UPI00196B9617